VAELLDAGIVRPSSSRLYATEYAVVKKKDEDGQWTDGRMVFDLRPTNLKTKLDRYPLPTPEYLFNKLGQAKYFSTMDLRSGFHQIPIHEDDVEKTAFYCGGAKYEFTRMPFGLKNAPIHFQRVMDTEIQRHGLQDFTGCFIDDIIIFSNTAEEHLQHIQQVMEMLDAVNLRFHPSKSIFMADSVQYLGHYVGPWGL
jgi:hypothetical protein